MADIVDVDDRVNPIDAFAEIISVIATGTVARGQIAYQLTTGKFGVADANDSGKEQARGVFLQAAGADQGVDLLIRGRCAGYTLTDQTWDDQIFLSDTAGAAADAAGTMTVPIGRVVAMTDKDLTKVIYFDFDWSVQWS